MANDRKYKKYIARAFESFFQGRTSHGKVILFDNEKKYTELVERLLDSEAAAETTVHEILLDEIFNYISHVTTEKKNPPYPRQNKFYCVDADSIFDDPAGNREIPVNTLLLYYLVNKVLPELNKDPELTILLHYNRKLSTNTSDGIFYFNSWESIEDLINRETLPRISELELNILQNRFNNIIEQQYLPAENLENFLNDVEHPQRGLLEILVEFIGFGKRYIDIINEEQKKIAEFKEELAAIDRRLDEHQLSAVTMNPRTISFVIATAGSGKTTKVMYNRMAMLDKVLHDKKRSLFITFNRSIMEQARHDIDAMGLNTGYEVHTYHSFANTYLKETNRYTWLRSGGLRNMDTHKKLSIIEKLQKKCKQKNYIDIFDVEQLRLFLDGSPLNAYEARILNSKLSSMRTGGTNTTGNSLELFDFFIRQEKLIFFHSLYDEKDLENWANVMQLRSIAHDANRSYYAALYLFLKEYIAHNDGVYTFDDMLFLFILDCRVNRKQVKNYLERFDHLFIDEFQDADMSNFIMIEYLLTFLPSATLVGDDDQIIYEWRGSSIDFFLNFQKIHPETTVRYLPTNYRCPRNVTTMAKKLINHNLFRFEKNIYPNRSKEREIVYLPFAHYESNDLRVNATVVRQIRDNYSKRIETAILCRTNDAVNAYTEVLKSLNISYSRMSEGSKDGFDPRMVSYIVIGTIHGAKGRTFDNVIFITSGIYYYDKNDTASMEEQRRVVYVAYTRTAGKLFISLDIQRNRRSGEYFYSAQEILRESGLMLPTQIAPKTFAELQPMEKPPQVQWFQQSRDYFHTNQCYVDEHTLYQREKIDDLFQREFGSEFEKFRELFEFDYEQTHNMLVERFPNIPLEILYYLKISIFYSEVSDIMYDFSMIPEEERFYHHIILTCGLAVELVLNHNLLPLLVEDFGHIEIMRGTKQQSLASLSAVHHNELTLPLGAFSYILNHDSFMNNDDERYCPLREKIFLDKFNRLRQLRNSSAHPDVTHTLKDESCEVQDIVFEGEASVFDVFNRINSSPH